VRDAALPSVPERLHDRDADVPCLVFDRVDHRLDALTDHVCLDLDQRALLSSSTTSRQTPSSRPIRSRTPTSRKPKRLSTARLVSFSGKTPVSSVQMPPASLSGTSFSSSIVPTPRPRAFSPTYA